MKKRWHSPYCFIANRKLEHYGLFHACCPKVKNFTTPFRGVVFKILFQIGSY